MHFLSAKYPVELQQQAVELFKSLANSSKDTLWLISAELSQRKHQPPDSRFAPLKNGCVAWGSVIMQGVKWTSEYVNSADTLATYLVTLK